jgi:hypothetical protein
MLFPKYVLEDLLVGSGSIIGKSNIKEFLNHISMHKDVEDKSLAELAPSYEVASAYLVHMLEARFASLNPFMQHMFLKLHDTEDSEKKDFILETLRREFRVKLGKFLSVLICLVHLLMSLVQTKKKPKYQYLANSWDCMRLLKIFLIGSVLKIFLVN